MLIPINELAPKALDEITRNAVFRKKEEMRMAYMGEDWATAIVAAHELLRLPISMVDREQAIWTKRKASEHLAAKSYL